MSIKKHIEAILLVSPKPVSLKEFSELFDLKEDLVNKALEELANDYKENDRGFLLIKSASKFQISSSPDSAKYVQKFLQQEVSGELTPASLETLTIVAYRGPIAKRDIEKIRGINCSLILKNLLIRGLIEEKQADEPEDNLYTVSIDFVKHLGISNVSELPDFAKFNNPDSLNELVGDN